jgi:flagellin
MSVINTNVKSLVAQNSLTKNNRELSVAMQRLSTGSRVNSAKDDAAGLAIGTRMTAQTRGLSMAIRNANDGISLLQTSEGALDEVTGALQRMRELAVQAVNGTNNASDRAALDLEVQQLKAEVDRIAVSTQFNNQALLDGSFKNKTLQIGDKAEQTMAISIGSARLNDLGLGGASGGNESIVGTRTSVGLTGVASANAVDAGDIQINGQSLGAIVRFDDLSDIVTNINNNIDGVTASAFNTVVMKNAGTGIQTGAASDRIEIEMRPNSSGTNLTGGITANITTVLAATTSMEELVDQINVQMGGLLTASLNDGGKLVLENDTGAAIKITVSGDGATALGMDVGNETFNGFLKLESTSGDPVRIERGNLAMASPGTLADLAVLGFNETTTEPVAENYTVTGAALSAPTTAWASGDLKINGVDIYDADIVTTSFDGKLNAINNFTNETGVSASAYFEKTFDVSNFIANQAVVVNGRQISTGSSISGFVTNLNAETVNTGLVATLNGSNIVMSGANTKQMVVDYIDPAVLAGTLASTVDAADTAGTDRTVTIAAADLVVGRTFELNVRNTAVPANSFTARYTVGTGDTVNSVADGLRDAILATQWKADGTARSTTSAGYTAPTGSVAPTVAAGVLTIESTTAAGYGSADISLRVVSTSSDPSKVFSTAISEQDVTASVARTVTFVSADFTVGKTYEMRIAGGGADDASGSVRVLIETGDTRTTIAGKFKDAINAATGPWAHSLNTLDKNNAATMASNATAVLTIAADALYGLASISISEVATPLGGAETSYGGIRLDSNSNTPIQVELSAAQSSSNGSIGLIEQNVGASDYDVNASSLGSSLGASLSGLSVANSGAANKAISSLDSALDQVNAMRATMGAMQNRLDRTVNNLSNVLANTEASRSQIMDTDYAVETTNLAKAQIIQQAATAMLAQANQQPQSVLALLQ